MTDTLASLAAARRRIALTLTGAMMALYFGFILLVAFGRDILARQVMPGLSLGILIGILVIVAAWVLVWIYVRWANAHYDAAAARLRQA